MREGWLTSRGSVTGWGKFVVEGIGAASLSWAVVWRVRFCVRLRV